MERISALGGVYSKTLDPSCTHLVIAQPVMNDDEPVNLDAIRTSKVDWALRRNAKAEQVRRRRQRPRDPRTEAEPSDERMIMIVWEGWFWDCVSFNGRFPEERWRLENVPEPPPHDYSAREMGTFIRESELHGGSLTLLLSPSERIEKDLEEKEREEREQEARLVQAVLDQDMKPALDVKMEPESANASDKAELKRLANVPDSELEQAQVRKRPRPTTSTTDGKNDSRTRLVDELISSLIIKPEPDSAIQPPPDPSARYDPPEHENSAPSDAKFDENTSPSKDNRARKRARLAPVDPAHSSLSSARLAPRPSATERVSVVHTSRAAAFDQSVNTGTKPALLAQSRSLNATGSLAPGSMAKRTAVPDMVKNMALNSVLFKDLLFSHDVEAGYEAMEAAIIGSGGKLVPLAEVCNGTFVNYLINRM